MGWIVNNWNNFLNNLLSNVTIWAAFLFLYRLGKSFLEDYWKTKAVNLATKQDIEELKEREQEVLSKFHKIDVKFDRTYGYERDFIETQYKELYAPLFWQYSLSEARKNHNQELSGTAILDVQGTDTPLLATMLDTIKKNKSLASPKLIEVAAYLEIELENKKIRGSGSISENEKRKLVNIIKSDYFLLVDALGILGNSRELT